MLKVFIILSIILSVECGMIFAILCQTGCTVGWGVCLANANTQLLKNSCNSKLITCTTLCAS